MFDAWKFKDFIINIPMIQPTFKEYHYKLQYFNNEILTKKSFNLCATKNSKRHWLLE